MSDWSRLVQEGYRRPEREIVTSTRRQQGSPTQRPGSQLLQQRSALLPRQQRG